MKIERFCSGGREGGWERKRENEILKIILKILAGKNISSLFFSTHLLI